MNDSQISVTIKIITVAVSAYFCSSAFIAIIGTSIPPSSSSLGKQWESTPRHKNILTLDAYKNIWEKNIFGNAFSGHENTLKTEAAAPPEPAHTENVAIPLSSLNFRLIGTVAGPTQNSFAIVENMSYKKQELYHKGDKLGNAVIKEIERNRIILDNNGKEEMLEVQFDTPVKSTEIKEKTSPQTKGISKVAADRYILDRKEVEQLSGDLSQFMTQVRVVPNQVKGVAAGYRLLNIAKGSLVESIGLKNGDIVEKINDKSVNKPEEAFLAYQQLKNGGSFSLELQRGGKKEVINYEIR